MTVKFKYNEEKETFSIKGMEADHIITIFTLLAHVRMGGGALSIAAGDLIDAYESSDAGGDLEYLVEDANVLVGFDMSTGETHCPLVYDHDGELVAPTIGLYFDSEHEFADADNGE